MEFFSFAPIAQIKLFVYAVRLLLYLYCKKLIKTSYFSGASIRGYLCFDSGEPIRSWDLKVSLLAYQGRGFGKFLGWVGSRRLVGGELTSGIRRVWLGRSASCWASMVPFLKISWRRELAMGTYRVCFG